MINLQFKQQIDAAALEVTRGVWQEQIAANVGNVSESYYEANLDYCEKVVAGTVGNPDTLCVCAVYRDDEPAAAALLITSHALNAKPGPSLKFMNLYVEPKLNVADAEPDLSSLAWLAARAVVGTLQMTYDDFPARSLKIYTGFPLDRDFMTAVTTAITGIDLLKGHFTVSHRGNWLQVDKVAVVNHAKAVELLDNAEGA